MTFRWLAFASLASTVLADYDSFYFTSKANWQCSGLGFECRPPSACSHDALTDKYYCCGPGTDSVCWTGSTGCSGSNSESAGDGQVDCGSFCCLGDRERCTQRQGQINICWATAVNPFANITDTVMNDTYSSISSNRPSATSLTFSLARVTATATSTQTSSTSSITPSGNSPSATSTADTSSGISGGAIAGIVIGVLAGLALIAGAAFFIVRSRRGRSATPHQEPYRPSAYAEKHQYTDAANLPPMQAPLAEMDAGPQSRPVQEWYGQAAEIDSSASGTYRSHQSAELPGSR